MMKKMATKIMYLEALTEIKCLRNENVQKKKETTKIVDTKEFELESELEADIVVEDSSVKEGDGMNTFMNIIVRK